MTEYILNFDNQIQILSESLVNSTPILKIIFGKITYLGSFELLASLSVSLFACFLLFYLLSENGKIFSKFLVPFILSILFVSVLVYFTKILVGRDGPPDRIFYETDFSFPSGHTASAFIFFSSLYYLLVNKIKSASKKYFFLFIVTLIIILVGVSRIILNVHYASDVVAGWIFGFLGLVFLRIVYKSLNRK